MFEKRIEEVNANVEVQEVPTTFEKRTYTVYEIQDILNVGKNAIYELVKSNAFHYVKVGGQYRISKKSFDNWLEGNQEIANE